MGERRLPGLGGAAGLLRQSCFAFDSGIDGVRVAYLRNACRVISSVHPRKVVCGGTLCP